MGVHNYRLKLSVVPVVAGEISSILPSSEIVLMDINDCQAEIQQLEMKDLLVFFVHRALISDRDADKRQLIESYLNSSSSCLSVMNWLFSALMTHPSDLAFDIFSRHIMTEQQEDQR